MTAGLTSRPIAGKSNPVGPQAIAVLLGTAVVAAALVGAATIGRLGAVGSNTPAAEAAAAAQAFIEFRAAERASEDVSAAPASSWTTQAYRDFRASERASVQPSDVAASSLAARAFSEYRASERASAGATASQPINERDSLRLEHIARPAGATGAGKAQDDLVMAGRLLPVTSAHAPGTGPLE